MKKEADVIIIGTGTAALSAASEVIKATSNFIIVSNGVYGTTCIRNGCMPSKALINAANLYHQRFHMENIGVQGIKDLKIDVPKVMEYVHELRAHFLKYLLDSSQKYDKYIIEGQAQFISVNEVKLNGNIYKAKKIIIATGSRPHIPDSLQEFKSHIITSDDVFELKTLPFKMAVIGMSILGAEMAPCFAQLGVKVYAFEKSNLIAGLTDPVISNYAFDTLSKEMNIRINTEPTVQFNNDKLTVDDIEVDKIFVAEHRVANITNLGLEELGIVDELGHISEFNPSTMQVSDLPIFVAGDVKKGRSILNEAIDEGKIAGRNAVASNVKSYPRRTALQVCHTSFPAAVIGKSFNEIKSPIIGESDFENQGCAKIMGQNKGKVRIYGEAKSGKLLGAELFAPRGEELAHMLSWIIARETTVEQALNLPYYHPSLAEGLKNAFQDLAKNIGPV